MRGKRPPVTGLGRMGYDRRARSCTRSERNHVFDNLIRFERIKLLTGRRDPAYLSLSATEGYLSLLGSLATRGERKLPSIRQRQSAQTGARPGGSRAL